MKKILSIFLAIILIITAMPLGAFEFKASAATSGKTGTCTWSLDGTVLTISGNGPMGSWYSYITQPWGRDITEVIIEDGVTRIGDYAFYNCRSLTSVTIPNSVKSIGYYAFEYCSSLTNVYITDIAAWCKIDFNTFYSNPLCYAKNLYFNCELVNDLIIPNSVTSIGDSAFCDCTSLTSVTIPNSVTSIGDSAFRYCTSLTSVTIPNSVTSIDDSAFWGCDNLTSVTIGDSITNISDYTFYDCTSLTSITIPDGVKSLGSFAFSRCTSLTSITIPTSVTSIGDHVFGECTNLTSVTIPTSVTSIGDGVFYYCDAIIRCYKGSYAASYCESNGVAYVYIDGADEESIINGKVGKISWSIDKRTGLLELTGNGAMVDFSNINPPWYDYKAYITSVEIYNGITSIGYSAFYGCRSLKSVTIPDSVISIGDYAFSDCDSLTSVYYRGSSSDESKISIGSYNFYLTKAIWYYNSCIGSVDHTYGNNNVCDECGYIKVLVPGDTNGTGEVDMEDISILSKYLAGWDVDCNEAALDVSGDGAVNLFDVVLLAQFVAGWDVKIF